ncbi:hypothetical protein DL98DRAFT_582929 [Cadophora sp. DSE1049]|nr:hypothetical protein DL98DRAFT_582929 [Cadophora sp. DSE1049]
MDYATNAAQGGELNTSDAYDMDVFSSEYFLDEFLSGNDEYGLTAQLPRTSTSQSHELATQNYGFLSSIPSISGGQDIWTSPFAPLRTQTDFTAIPSNFIEPEVYSWEHSFTAPQASIDQEQVNWLGDYESLLHKPCFPIRAPTSSLQHPAPGLELRFLPAVPEYRPYIAEPGLNTLFVERDVTARAVGVQQPDPVLVRKQWAILQSQRESQVHLAPFESQADLYGQHHIPHLPFTAQVESNSWGDTALSSQPRSANLAVDAQCSLESFSLEASTIKTISGKRHILPKVEITKSYTDGVCPIERQLHGEGEDEQSCTQCRFNGIKCKRVSDYTSP